MKIDPKFTEWWHRHGRLVRSGGGDYESCFAYAAWKWQDSASDIKWSKGFIAGALLGYGVAALTFVALRQGWLS